MGLRAFCVANLCRKTSDFCDEFRDKETETPARTPVSAEGSFKWPFMTRLLGLPLISKRMVKKQQMRWTPRGAHLLLQVRTWVLNDALRPTFEGWYPGLKPDIEPTRDAAA